MCIKYIFLHLVISHFVYFNLLIVASLFKQIFAGMIYLQRMKRTEGNWKMKGGKLFDQACDNVFVKGQNSMGNL